MPADIFDCWSQLKAARAENKELKLSCNYHVDIGRQRLDRIHKLEAENERLKEALKRLLGTKRRAEQYVAEQALKENKNDS